MHKCIAYALCVGYVIAPLSARVGCIDNSYHTDHTNGPDFKDYHYVSCLCPCQRYRQLTRASQCSKCNHYHADPSTIYMS